MFISKETSQDICDQVKIYKIKLHGHLVLSILMEKCQKKKDQI